MGQGARKKRAGDTGKGVGRPVARMTSQAWLESGAVRS